MSTENSQGTNELNERELAHVAGAGWKPEWECKKCGCKIYYEGFMKVKESGGEVYTKPARICKRCHDETPLW